MERDKISIVVNFKNLTQSKHIFFYKIMKKFNSTRNFYFIKIPGKPRNENLNKLVENNFVKIVQSIFPDSIFFTTSGIVI